MPQAGGNASDARRLFELTVLHEASRELAALSTPAQIVRSFLLTVMGATGAASGFILLFGPDEKDDLVHHRGLGSAQAARLESGAAAVRGDWFGGAPGGQAPAQPHILSVEAMGRAYVLPADTRFLIRWTQDAGGGGLLGIGPGPGLSAGSVRLTGQEHEFLLSLMDCLQGAMSRAWLTARLAVMGGDLAARNADLDRRVYQQESIIQALAEMSGLTDPRALTESFLLFLMGAAGAWGGYALILAKDGSRRLESFKGMDRDRADGLDPARLRQVVTREVFSGGGARAGYLDEGDELSGCGLPRDCPGVWFAAQDGSYGFAGLCGPVLNPALEASRKESLKGVAGVFLACLRNALLLEELQTRNRELEETLAEITNCRIEIDGLEKAKARIKQIVASEMGRVSRASWADFAILLLVSAAVGLLFNMASPSGVPLVPPHWSRPATPQIAPRDAAALLDASAAVLVDARPPELFKQGHIPGAVNLSPPLFDFMYGMRMARLPKDKPVLVYGGNISRHYDEEVAGLLAKRGHTAVRIIPDGLGAWRKQGLPVKQ